VLESVKEKTLVAIGDAIVGLATDRRECLIGWWYEPELPPELLEEIVIEP